MILFNKYKVVNMFRFKLFIVILLVIMLVPTIYSLKAFSLNKVDFEYIEVIVRKNDTIWDIANEYYNGNKDIRKIIHDISRINNIDNSIIKPGQTIIVPIKD